MKKYVPVISAIIFLVSACQHHTVPVISSRTSDPPPPVKKEQAGGTGNTDGKMLFQARCVKCHALPDPGAFTAARWEGILQRMAPKAKLTGTETAALKSYLLASAAR